jgi:Cupredoxin-like domain
MARAASCYKIILTLSIVSAAAFPSIGRAAEPIRLTLKDHLFSPAEVTVPANERFRIEVANQDPTPAEFESSDLRVEKIIVGGGKISVMAGPLKPGTYRFFDDYNPDTAKGTVIAAPAKE